MRIGLFPEVEETAAGKIVKQLVVRRSEVPACRARLCCQNDRGASTTQTFDQAANQHAARHQQNAIGNASDGRFRSAESRGLDCPMQ
jgi:hypothetical protein